MLLFASDLDNTLIFSYKKAAKGNICVEVKDGKNLSYMSEKTIKLLAEVDKKAIFAPITTRSLEQYRRISLLKGKQPLYALTANGGTLLKNGMVDEDWRIKTKLLIADAMEELEKSKYFLAQCKEIYMEPKLVDEMFVFAKTGNIATAKALLCEKLDTEKVYVDSNGEKLYVFPKILDKGLALRRLKYIVNATKTISAGDSLFDVPMLLEADEAIIPNDKALVHELKHKKNVMVSEKSGAFFSEDVLEFVLSF